VKEKHKLAHMKAAFAYAECSTAVRLQVGCVIVKDKQILVTGYVGSPPGQAHCDEVGHIIKEIKHENGEITKHCLRTTHCEMNALAQAAKKGIPIDGATIYCTMAPCFICSKALVTAGIKRAVVQKDYHWAKESKKLFEDSGAEYVILTTEMETYDEM